MKKVWATTDLDILEGKESNEDNEEPKKKTVILVAEKDDGVHATFEQNDIRNIAIV